MSNPLEDKEELNPGQSQDHISDAKTSSDLDAENYFTDEEVKELYAEHKTSKYNALDAFQTPLDILFTFNPAVKDGTLTPNKWQIEELRRLARPYTKENPLRWLLVGVNGSGKDQMVINSFAVWLALAHVRSRCIITSASANQINTQTEPAIRSMIESINTSFMEAYGVAPFKMKRQHYICTFTGSEIKLFVTDEPGRAEGYHPHSDYPKGKVAVIVNEAKTVPDSIFFATRKCTTTHYMLVSSPGRTSGEFFRIARTAVQYPAPWQPFKWYARIVTSYDCTHIPKELIDSDKDEFGEHSVYFRQRHKGEFTSLDEKTVIAREVLDKCVNKGHIEYGEYTGDIKHKLPSLLHAGLDLAKGGDENTFYSFNGNKFHMSNTFRCGDITVTVPLLIGFFTAHGFTKETSDHIYADDGGIGGGIIDLLHSAGWMVVRTVNQSKPLGLKGIHANRGAELWFRFARMIEECQIILPKDDTKLLDQLSSRNYDQADNGRLRLESKEDARLKGHGSPDRADAVILAFSRITIHDLLETDGVALTSKKTNFHMPSQKELVQQQINLLKMERIAGRSLSFGDASERKINIRNLHRAISAGSLN